MTLECVKTLAHLQDQVKLLESVENVYYLMLMSAAFAVQKAKSMILEFVKTLAHLQDQVKLMESVGDVHYPMLM